MRISDEGEIQVSGPGLTDGYHGRRVDTAGLLDQGWLRTGDAGVLDAEGRLRVLGRVVRAPRVTPGVDGGSLPTRR